MWIRIVGPGADVERARDAMLTFLVDEVAARCEYVVLWKGRVGRNKEVSAGVSCFDVIGRRKTEGTSSESTSCLMKFLRAPLHTSLC